MSGQIRLVTNAQLEAQVNALRMENEGLRCQLQICLDKLPAEDQASESCDNLDPLELCKKINYLEHRRKTSIKKCEELELDANYQAFCDENKLAVLCNIKDIEKWKIKLIDQELSYLTFQLHTTKNENYEDKIAAACSLLVTQLEDCEDTENPYIIDVFNDLDL